MTNPRRTRFAPEVAAFSALLFACSSSGGDAGAFGSGGSTSNSSAVGGNSNPSQVGGGGNVGVGGFAPSVGGFSSSTGSTETAKGGNGVGGASNRGGANSGGMVSAGGTRATTGGAGTGGTRASGGATSGGATHTGVWKVMPLGDSITGTTCYPQLTSQTLKSGGHTNFQFVGTNLNNQGCNGAPTVQTEGHGGYLVTNLTTNTPTTTGKGTLSELKTWATAKPDIVLMHFGTNDAWSRIAPATILNAYVTVMTEFRNQNPSVIFFVSRDHSTGPERLQQLLEQRRQSECSDHDVLGYDELDCDLAGVHHRSLDRLQCRDGHLRWSAPKRDGCAKDGDDHNGCPGRQGVLLRHYRAGCGRIGTLRPEFGCTLCGSVGGGTGASAATCTNRWLLRVWVSVCAAGSASVESRCYGRRRCNLCHLETGSSSASVCMAFSRTSSTMSRSSCWY
ncbi:MAG: GDSL-type esterase/lipase family protein [Polyangiaceae bacterium]